ncbi:MAG: maleylacetoacetate isomerase [Proteobacteria bacterium]|nr:maleylacetoacetate isomerase [Pseudomonadota bacterium]
MKLYSYYRSSASYRVRIALNHKKLSYEHYSVHLVRNGGEQHAPEYKALNPQAQVPTFIDGDFVLTQSMAIMEYLEEKYPKPHILPKEPEQRAYVRQLSQICVADIHPLNNLKILNHLSGEFSISQDQKTAWYRKWVEQGFDALETLLGRSPFRTGPYCCGDQITMADMCLVPQVYNARRYEIPMTPWPLMAEIDDSCLKLKAFQDASPEHQPDTPDDQRPSFLKVHS